MVLARAEQFGADAAQHAAEQGCALFHHALGLTPGCRALVADLAADGHVVHVPDLYDGRTFDSLDEGVAHAQEVGFGVLLDRAADAVAGLTDRLVYVGVSLGVKAMSPTC